MAELLRARRRQIRDVWVEDGAKPSPVLDRIVSMAAAARVPLRRVSGERLMEAARTGAPQGVLARAEPLPEADLDDLCRPDPRTGRTPFVLAVDGVTDPQNLGALLRSADGAGVTGAVLPRHRAAHVTPAAAKAAAGAIEWLPLASVGGIPSALARASDLGLWVIGLHPEGDENLFELSLPGPVSTTGGRADGVVVVLGAEGKGLSSLVRRRCDILAAIPLRGALPSLNVAAAGAIALFELSRRFVPADTGEVFKAGGPPVENL